MVWRRISLILMIAVWVFPGCASKNRASRDGVISQELPLTVDDLSEIKEGLANHKRVLWQYQIYRSPKLQKYCDLIAADIAEVSTRPHLPYHVTILDSDEVNIFGGPGGYIYITKGMFKYIKTEGELAGILAHEITHVAHYEYSNIPQLTKVKRVYGLMLSGSELVKNTGMAGPYGSATNMVLSETGKRAPAIFKRFTSDQEVNTDEVALESLVKAGYDPREYQGFVEKLARINMDEVGRFVLLLNTHPPFEERRKHLASRIKGLKLKDSSAEPGEDDLFQAIQQHELNPAPQPAPLPPPEPPKSIVFEPQFRAVTDSPPAIEAGPARQQNKMSPDRKRMPAWF